MRVSAPSERVSASAVRRAASHVVSRIARPHPFPREGRHRPTAAAPDRTVAFLAPAGLHPAVLAAAGDEARRLRVPADAALLASGVVEEDAFYRALARHIGVPFVTECAPLAPGLDYASAVKAGIAPLQRWPGGPRFVMAPRGNTIATLDKTVFGRDIVLTTPRRFEQRLRESTGGALAADAVMTVETAAPGLSAAPRQVTMFWPAALSLFAVAAFVCWIDASVALNLVIGAFWLVFMAGCTQRILTGFASFEPTVEPRPLSAAALPTYTILIALYREANMAGALIAALEQLDYPRAKLDIKFIVECDDRDTARALRDRLPGVAYEIIVAPDGEPRTKPRALNIGLPFARGELLTIFDAEDRPHPMQLRHAAAAFARNASDVACIQARLAIDNGRQGWLQGLYALDYAALFTVTNPGLAYLSAPIFLGGSSNHFRRDALLRIGSWDAWNVTEDADLGVRLARFGYRVDTCATLTGEEAPSTWRGFMAQRIRWKKGWLQTAAVHLRRPLILLRDLKIVGCLSLLATFATGLLGPMTWPAFFGLFVWHAATTNLLAPHTTAEIIRSTMTCLLVYCGAVALLTPLLIGATRSNLRRSLFLLPLLPLWHVALCVAAWMALFEFWRDPYRWAKTTHGDARRDPLVTGPKHGSSSDGAEGPRPLRGHPALAGLAVRHSSP